MPPTHPVRIRRAVPADLPALGRLGALLLDVHYGFDRLRFLSPGAGVADGYARFLGTQLAEADSLVLVAERDGAIVGYVYAGIEPYSWKELRDEAGFIHDVVVASEGRGAGAATALMEAAFEWMRGRGAVRVMLWTSPANTQARRVFDRMGFRSTMVEMTLEL